MNKETKNRLLSFVYIAILVVCVAAIVFLLVQYLRANAELRRLESEHSEAGLLTQARLLSSYARAYFKQSL